MSLTRFALVKGRNKATEDRARQFTIDVSKVVIPKGWTITPLEAGQMAAKAVRMDFKDKKLTEIVITDGEKVWGETAEIEGKDQE